MILRKRYNSRQGVHDDQIPIQHLAERGFSTRSVKEKYLYGGQVQEQPPPSQSIRGLLKPTSPEEACVAPLLARSNLLITRDIEWANLVLGFEQGKAICSGGKSCFLELDIYIKGHRWESFSTNRS